MTHYPACFHIPRLAFDASLGLHDFEHAARQPVAVELRLYFPQAPGAVENDRAEVIDYKSLCDLLVATAQSQHYRLIEYLAGALFRAVRQTLDGRQPEPALWLKLSKCQPRVAHLEGGASFVVSDLPPSASVVPV